MKNPMKNLAFQLTFCLLVFMSLCIPLYQRIAISGKIVNNQRIAIFGKMVNNSTERQFQNRCVECLLTMFTTWDYNNSTAHIQNNTIRNWSTLSSRVQFIVYSNDQRVKAQIRARPGWYNRDIPSTATPPQVIVLKYLFLDVMKNFKSKYYCFSNSDVLFTDTLLKTLEAVDQHFNNTKRPLLLTGQRWNVLNITEKDSTTYTKLEELAIHKGRLTPVVSADHFLTNRYFPWLNVADVAIGIPRVDTWIMDLVRKDWFIGIEATRTVLAVHQSTSIRPFLSSSETNADYNDKLIALSGMKLYGASDQLPYFTTLDLKTKKVIINERHTKRVRTDENFKRHFQSNTSKHTK